MKNEPSFLDFEASSLASASYPIEVAWSLADGSIDVYMISPTGVDKWTDWSIEAQEIHGITRKELLAHGKTPAWVCRRMNQQLSGKIVYTDNPDYDGMWLAELFTVCSGSKPEFELAHIDDLLVSIVCPSVVGRVQGLLKIEEMKEEARRLVERQHRAEWDVRYLIGVMEVGGRMSAKVSGGDIRRASG